MACDSTCTIIVETEDPSNPSVITTAQGAAGAHTVTITHQDGEGNTVTIPNVVIADPAANPCNILSGTGYEPKAYSQIVARATASAFTDFTAQMQAIPLMNNAPVTRLPYTAVETVTYTNSSSCNQIVEYETQMSQVITKAPSANTNNFDFFHRMDTTVNGTLVYVSEFTDTQEWPGAGVGFWRGSHELSGRARLAPGETATFVTSISLVSSAVDGFAPFTSYGVWLRTDDYIVHNGTA